jgi:hypothetical protein
LLRGLTRLLCLDRDERPRLLAQPVDPVAQVAERDASLRGELALRQVARLEVCHEFRPPSSLLIGHGHLREETAEDHAIELPVPAVDSRAVTLLTADELKARLGL